VICTVAGQWGKPTCSHTVLSDSVGTTHGSSTSQTSRPYSNARLYEHRQHIICWFKDIKWLLINNLRDNNLCSTQTADIHYRENLNFTQCTAVVCSPAPHDSPMSQSIKPIQSILHTSISIISPPLPVLINIITTKSKVFSLA
jgi:hypothetical protein